MCFRPTNFNRRIKRCPSCQTMNPPTLKNCKKCGADLPEEAELMTPNNSEQTSSESKGPNKPTP